MPKGRKTTLRFARSSSGRAQFNVLCWNGNQSTARLNLQGSLTLRKIYHRLCLILKKELHKNKELWLKGTAEGNYFSASDAGYLKIKAGGSKYTLENRKKEAHTVKKWRIQLLKVSLFLCEGNGIKLQQVKQKQTNKKKIHKMTSSRQKAQGLICKGTEHNKSIFNHEQTSQTAQRG